MKKQTNREKGQALIESVLLIPIIVVIISMIFWHARILLTKQQLLMASRYGTDLILYTNKNSDQIKADIIDYLCGRENEGRLLDRKVLQNNNIDIQIQRDSLDPLGGIEYGGNGLARYSSHVIISYDFNIPWLFSAWGNYVKGSINMVKKLKIAANSEVLAGTGCKGDHY